jgi:hypothetical protein
MNLKYKNLLMVFLYKFLYCLFIEAIFEELCFELEKSVFEAKCTCIL